MTNMSADRPFFQMCHLLLARDKFLYLEGHNTDNFLDLCPNILSGSNIQWVLCLFVHSISSDVKHTYFRSYAHQVMRPPNTVEHKSQKCWDLCPRLYWGPKFGGIFGTLEAIMKYLITPYSYGGYIKRLSLLSDMLLLHMPVFRRHILTHEQILKNWFIPVDSHC